VTPGLLALHENRAYLDLSNRGRIRVTGEDRARLIHALSTNHIQSLRPGGILYAFFLTAQGRIVADSWISCFDDYLLLDVEPESRETVLKHINHYIIADDAALEDITSDTYCILAGTERHYGPIHSKPDAIERLGRTEATSQDAHTFRVASYRPRFGEDFNSTTLPQETGLTSALHFSKGCYLGQEIVERIRSRGHVNKKLVGLRVSGPELFQVGSKVLYNGEETGHITSSAPGAAIAMVRIQAATPGTSVQIDAINAEVTAVS
jgi:folate-binding Fe-S cluster repair protein YgfZ